MNDNEQEFFDSQQNEEDEEQEQEMTNDDDEVNVDDGTTIQLNDSDLGKRYRNDDYSTSRASKKLRMQNDNEDQDDDQQQQNEDENQDDDQQQQQQNDDDNHNEEQVAESVSHDETAEFDGERFEHHDLENDNTVVYSDDERNEDDEMFQLQLELEEEEQQQQQQLEDDEWTELVNKKTTRISSVPMSMATPKRMVINIDSDNEEQLEKEPPSATKKQASTPSVIQKSSSSFTSPAVSSGGSTVRPFLDRLMVPQKRSNSDESVSSSKSSSMNQNDAKRTPPSTTTTSKTTTTTTNTTLTAMLKQQKALTTPTTGSIGIKNNSVTTKNESVANNSLQSPTPSTQTTATKLTPFEKFKITPKEELDSEGAENFMLDDSVQPNVMVSSVGSGVIENARTALNLFCFFFFLKRFLLQSTSDFEIINVKVFNFSTNCTRSKQEAF
jgi:hypothetical protein